jgi:hypothetical protein
MDNDPSVAQFRKQSPVIILCDEGEEFSERYARNAAAHRARERIAERERLARLRGVEIGRTELRVVEESTALGDSEHRRCSGRRAGSPDEARSFPDFP